MKGIQDPYDLVPIGKKGSLESNISFSPIVDRLLKARDGVFLLERGTKMWEKLDRKVLD